MIAFVAVLLGVVLLGGIFLLNTGGSSVEDDNSNSNEIDSSPIVKEADVKMPLDNIVMTSSEVKTVEITSSGFLPDLLEVSVGDRVMFVNRDTRPHWPATNDHPSHRIYPGSSVGKCGTSMQTQTFDACKGLSRGESFVFTFGEAGNWRYHDHLNPGTRGTIVVR